MWRDFKSYLKYKRKEMKFDELIVRSRIEEDNRNTERKTTIQIGANFDKTSLNVVNKQRKISGVAPRRYNPKILRNLNTTSTTVEKMDINQINVESQRRLHKQMWLQETTFLKEYKI